MRSLRVIATTIYKKSSQSDDEPFQDTGIDRRELDGGASGFFRFYDSPRSSFSSGLLPDSQQSESLARLLTFTMVTIPTNPITPKVKTHNQ